MTRTPPRREQGFALVMALVAILILALIAWAVMTLGHTDARLARNAAETARLTGVSDAAINLTLLRLLGRPQAADQMRNSPTTIVFEGQAVQVSMQDEAGKVDLNQAPEAVVRSLWTAQGMDVDAAQVLTDRILDWREAGPGKHLNGASAEDYQTAGRPYGPRQAPFESVTELKLVLGVPLAAAGRVVPLITVYAQQPTVDVRVAPSAVLQTLRQDDQTRAAAALDERDGEDLGNGGPMQPIGINGAVGRVYTITATATGPRGVRLVRTATVRLTGLAVEPYWIYRWE